jgi:hypothetical protein
MTIIRTRNHTNKGVKDCIKITPYPNSTKEEVRKFLNSRGMRETLTIPLRINEYQFT